MKPPRLPLLVACIALILSIVMFIAYTQSHNVLPLTASIAALVGAVAACIAFFMLSKLKYPK